MVNSLKIPDIVLPNQQFTNTQGMIFMHSRKAEVFALQGNMKFILSNPIPYPLGLTY